MAPRPTGVDGRDHNYRMVIEDRYKALAEMKGTIGRMLGVSALFVLIRTAWQAVSLIQGYHLPPVTYGALACEALTLVLYAAAKIGTTKESLPLLKLFNTFQGLTTCLVVLSSFHYHMGVAHQGEPVYIYSQLWRQLAEAGKLGSLKPETVGKVGEQLELVVDLVASNLLVVSTFLAHRFITVKMQMKKQAAKANGSRGQLAAGTDSKKDGAGEEPQEEKEAKVVRAVASSRTRERRRAA